MSQERAAAAYDAFCRGFRSDTVRLPPWDSLDAWMRDCMVVAYYQGNVDGAGARRELHDALCGLLGLIQLLLGRDDMPQAIRDAIHENHRYHTALEVAG